MRNFSAFGAAFRECLNKIQSEVKKKRREFAGKAWDRLSKAALLSRCCRSLWQPCWYPFFSHKNEFHSTIKNVMDYKLDKLLQIVEKLSCKLQKADDRIGKIYAEMKVMDYKLDKLLQTDSSLLHLGQRVLVKLALSFTIYFENELKALSIRYR
ncbi:hypothetical protein DM860_010152 [Cuscuta australis]|uniref:Uncharacterized protein n=1 Tax=Cuscuta australis TaxID=267555 RepID=A0A328DA82_9ASTE|nr:hypothetical protein DM860_010152 [Cuscuta australis]